MYRANNQDNRHRESSHGSEGRREKTVDTRREVYNNLYHRFSTGTLKREDVSESDIEELADVFKTTRDPGVKEGVKEILDSINGNYHL